jgi:hypothetical protein
MSPSPQTDSRLEADRQTFQPTRRNFLRDMAALTAGMFALPTGGREGQPLLPTVPFGPHRVTRLITGSNPIFGYSHFNRILDQLMIEYYTDERVASFLIECEQAGINTYQSNYRERAQRQYKRMREAGCRVNWICLGDYLAADNNARTPTEITAAMARCVSVISPAKPIAIAHHGSRTDALQREGKLDLVKTLLDKAHDAGFMAGISTHIPDVVEIAEEKGWPTDFYMTCFYRMSRQAGDYQAEIGVLPAGETYLESDPPRMCKVICQTRKPCLAFKILAAGRKCDSPEQVRRAFEFAFKNIKPTDAVIVGMFPRFSDQLSENVRIVRELAS